jgi:hypothetical protein
MTTDTQDRTYINASTDKYAAVCAALYHGLVSRGVPEQTAAWLVAMWMQR